MPALIEPFEKTSKVRERALDRLLPFVAVAALIVMATLFVFFAVWAILLLT